MTTPRLVETLLHARRSGELLDGLPDELIPQTLEDAYAASDGLAEHFGPVAGWKVGATSLDGQRLLGLAEPFAGRIFADTVLYSPARLVTSAAGYGLEPEIGFRLGRDLGPIEGGWNEQNILEAIESVVPLMEINRPSYRHPFDMGGLSLIADNGVNHGAVLGAPIADWRDLDLTAAGAVLSHNGEHLAEGTGAAVLGHPLKSLVWLANDRARRGDPVRAGQFVATGAMCRPAMVAEGDTVEADFGPLGRLHAEVRGT